MKDSSACIEGEILDSGYSSEEQKNIYIKHHNCSNCWSSRRVFFFSCPVAISHIALKIFKSRFVDTMKDFYIVFKIYLIVQKKIFLVELKFWNGCIRASLSPPPSKPKTYWSRFPQPHVMNIYIGYISLGLNNRIKYVRHFAQPCGPKKHQNICRHICFWILENQEIRA